MQTIRVATINLWGDQPPLEARMRGLADGLGALDADLIALQEVRQIPGVLPNQAETLARALGMNCRFAVATPNVSFGHCGDEGLALLSRFPFAAQSIERELPHATADERRILLGAIVETPAGALAAFTTHLTYRLTDGLKREDQVAAAEALVAETPSDLPKVWMGDFNAAPEADEIRFLRGLHSLAGRRVFYQDAFAAMHPGEDGFTWARANPHVERLRWLAPDRRIDYIFVSAERRDGRGRVQGCRIALDRPDASGCFPSDHFGLVAEVRVAPLDPPG
ncbi:MAG TPA: endonuclease/exonuclease/phosphatase family protein [Polyangia bacterium]